MADLIITKEVLEDSTTKLQHISDELEHQKSDDRELDDVYGQSDVHSAMSSFAGDWRIHRDKMKGAISDLRDKMQKATDTWTSLETDLASKLTTESENA